MGTYPIRVGTQTDLLTFLLLRYCTFISRDPVQCYHEVSAQFLKGFFSWVCDQRRGKGGRRRPGIKHTCSLGTFWKWYQLVYKIEAGRKIDDMVMRQGLDVSRS